MKPREIIKIFEQAGWREYLGKNHAISVISPTGQKVPISNHPSKDVAFGTLKKIERISGVKLT